MRAKDRLAALGQGRLVFVLLSLLLLAPCFWQPRLQAGDLSSHIYNSWLAALVESGRLHGLIIVRQWTNVLFDLMLAGLFRVVGPEAAQRIGVSIAVLTFVWGAFTFVSAVSGRRAWHLLPCLSMLAYGWVFHMGFFNFYLSMGLCFWALALAWDWQRWRVLAALLVLVLAYLAHALPVVWTLGLFTYTWLARRMEPFRRGLLAGGFVLVLVIFHSIVGARSLTSWSPLQLTLSPGEDQAWAFDTKYYVVLMGLVIIWGLLFMQLVRRLGAREVVSSIPFQLCVIGAAAVFILPGTVLIPGFYHALSYIAERMSLGVAVCLCALLGAGRPRLLERCALLVVAFTFFGFIYHDERTLNSFEDRMQDVVSRVQPEKRFDSPYIPAPHGGMLRIEDRRVVIYQVGGNTSGRVII